MPTPLFHENLSGKKFANATDFINDMRARYRDYPDVKKLIEIVDAYKAATTRKPSHLLDLTGKNLGAVADLFRTNAKTAMGKQPTAKVVESRLLGREISTWTSAADILETTTIDPFMGA